MAVKRKEASIGVVEAAEQRLINVFKNGVPVYMSFSGGKDSLALAQLVVNLIQQGKIDKSLLVVEFIDEEAIFPCIEKTVVEWRKMFILLGVNFSWYCLEVRHYNCFNSLANDESFICWDSTKEDVWVRRPPQFAVRNHKLLRPRVDTYQDFLHRVDAGGISITGVRTAESIQRLQNFAKATQRKKNITGGGQIYPIYDWSTNDVWLYLKEQRVEIPDIYLYLWQAGTGKNQLRVSQFFSIDTARSLVKMNEYYPDLMERITRREPNAYLAALYWDSEMFGRSTKSRRELEKIEVPRDYKTELIRMFSNMNVYFPTQHKMYVAKRYKAFFLQVGSFASDKAFKEIYEALSGGDPKLRSLRALYIKVYGKYIEQAKIEGRAQHAG